MDVIPAGSGGLWNDEDPTSTMTIWMRPTLLNGAQNKAGKHLLQRPQTQQRDVHLFRLALILKEETQNATSADPFFIDGLGIALAARVLGLWGAGERKIVGAELSKQKLRRVLGYIEQNLSQEISIAALAGLCNLSPSHFRVLFRQTVGRSVHRFVVERRIDRARALLESGQASISQAALESGFCDQGHLARRMRQVLGITPSALRPTTLS